MHTSGTIAPPPVTAPRLRRPSWRDTRLIVGLVLVLASVALGARLVAAADETVPVYAARATLPPGTPLGSDVLTVARARVTGTDAAYLDARRGVPSGRVLLRSVGAGEIVPVSAVGSATQLQKRPVIVPLEGPPPAGLVTGGLADVWASERSGEGGSSERYAMPRRLARGVEVFHVATGTGSLSPTRATTVEVLLDEAELRLVLDALANEARTAVVPVPGSAPSGEGEGEG